MRTTTGFRSVIIFGGAGFIGCNWACHLLRHTEARVHVFDSLARQGARHNLEWLQKAAAGSGRLQITVGDVRDATLVERAVRPATEVYHFAAQVAMTRSLEDPRLDFEVNVGGTLNVLEAARKSGRRPFLLFTSTNKVYGDLASAAESARDGGIAEGQPLDFCSPYGCSKGAADQYVRDYSRSFDLPTVVLRMSCVAGPRQFGNEDQGWVAHFLFSALAGRPTVIFGDGRQVRDVLYISDLLRAFELVRQAGPASEGQVYNIGGGAENAVSLLQLVAEIEQVTGRRLEYVHDERRIGDQLRYVTDFGKLQRDAGWRPTVGVRESLREMATWWRRHRALFGDEPAAAAADSPRVMLEVPEAAA